MPAVTNSFGRCGPHRSPKSTVKVIRKGSKFKRQQPTIPRVAALPRSARSKRIGCHPRSKRIGLPRTNTDRGSEPQCRLPTSRSRRPSCEVKPDRYGASRGIAAGSPQSSSPAGIVSPPPGTAPVDGNVPAACCNPIVLFSPSASCSASHLKIHGHAAAIRPSSGHAAGAGAERRRASGPSPARPRRSGVPAPQPPR